MKTKLTCLIAGLLLLLGNRVEAQILPSSSTAWWTPIVYGPSVYPDFFNDQQTGSSEGDIVGDLVNASLYVSYYNGGTTNLFTDGQLAFRFRLGEDKSPAGYKGVAVVGMDLNLDGRLDLFVGVNNSGSSPMIGLWWAGGGANSTPSSTSISSTATYSYGETAANFSWVPVSLINDPTATSTDLDGGGRNDYFLSFMIPFADLVAMAGTVVPGFDESSTVNFVAITGTQLNNLNQDINGINGGINSGVNWTDLGAFSQTYTGGGQLAVPEPSSAALGGILLAALLIFRRPH